MSAETQFTNFLSSCGRNGSGGEQSPIQASVRLDRSPFTIARTFAWTDSGSLPKHWPRNPFLALSHAH